MHCSMAERGNQVFNFSTSIFNQYLECKPSLFISSFRNWYMFTEWWFKLSPEWNSRMKFMNTRSNVNPVARVLETPHCLINTLVFAKSSHLLIFAYILDKITYFPEFDSSISRNNWITLPPTSAFLHLWQAPSNDPNTISYGFQSIFLIKSQASFRSPARAQRSTMQE